MWRFSVGWGPLDVSKDHDNFIFNGRAFEENWSRFSLEDRGNTILRNVRHHTHTHKTSERHIPKDSAPHQYSWENFKSRKWRPVWPGCHRTSRAAEELNRSGDTSRKSKNTGRKLLFVMRFCADVWLVTDISCEYIASFSRVDCVVYWGSPLSLSCWNKWKKDGIRTCLEGAPAIHSEKASYFWSDKCRLG